ENQARDAGELYVLANEVLFEPNAVPPPVFLNIDIQPVLTAACLPCHAGDAPDGDLRLDIIQNSMVDLLGPDGTGAMSTQVSGLRIKPTDPAQTHLLQQTQPTAPHPPQLPD